MLDSFSENISTLFEKVMFGAVCLIIFGLPAFYVIMTKGLEIYMKWVTPRLETENWKVRLKAIKGIQRKVNWGDQTGEQIIQLLCKRLDDPHQLVQREAILSLIALTNKGHLQRYSSFTHLMDRVFLPMLEDNDPHVRAATVTALGKIRDPHTIIPVFQRLYDNHDKVRKNAITAIKNICSSGHTMIFANNTIKVLKANQSLYSPGFSRFLRFLLREIHIYPETCNIQQVHQFITHVFGTMKKTYLKKYLTIRIYGNPVQFHSSVYESFRLCKRVEVHIDKVIFGSETSLIVPDSDKSLFNPDVTESWFPMVLQQIIIHTQTYNFYLIERFLTYAVNSIGQQYLKNHVEVQIYGKPDNLHPNIRNNLTNLCKGVYNHEDDNEI